MMDINTAVPFHCTKAVFPYMKTNGGNQFDRNKALPIGSIEDNQMPLKCLKKESYPEDLVGTALFLASDDSKLITGQLIVHDAGISFH